jgi:uncharacterized protein (TIGR03066 family)
MSRIALSTLSVIAAALLLLLGRTSLAADVDAAKLPGKWESKTAQITQTWTFSKDGSCSFKVKSDFLNREESGTYKIAKNVLTLTIEKASDEQRKGKSRDFIVVELSDKKLKIAEDPKDETTVAEFQRSKDAK